LKCPCAQSGSSTTSMIPPRLPACAPPAPLDERPCPGEGARGWPLEPLERGWGVMSVKREGLGSHVREAGGVGESRP